jgi:glycosyltransferase involved in cell wall biosynthesis
MTAAAPEFLSICIPTRNRSVWLTRALSRLASELHAGDIGPDVVRIYISDNCSTDDTGTVARTFQDLLPHLAYSRHPSNLGGDPNIIHCHNLGTGTYRWVMGDDDAIRPHALAYILDRLRTLQPALFINSEGRYACGFRTPAEFDNYPAFANTCMRVNPHMLLAHSLITANIFRSDCFNYELAMSRITTCYGHMYGLVEPLLRASGGVFVTDRTTITVRDSSLDPIDGIWPTDMYKLWGDYLDWLKAQIELKELDRSCIPEYIRRAFILELKTHPFMTAWRHAKHLHRAQTWKALRKLLTSP